MKKHHSKSVAWDTPTAPGYRREPPTWQGEASRPPLHPPRKARAEMARQEWQP
jgi:hypothetical protein